jgi:hypothetical protein
LGALTAVMDLASAWQAANPEGRKWAAQRLYAIGRHALGDLSQVLQAPPRFDAPDRLSEQDLRAVHESLTGAGVQSDYDAFVTRLRKLRKGYEPYAFALSKELLMELPPWMPPEGRKDNWETTAWEGSAPGDSLR